MKISQREARRLKRQLREVEAILNGQKKSWSSSWPDGTVVGSDEGVHPETISAINTSRKLGHAIVATVEGNRLLFHAMKLPSEAV